MRSLGYIAAILRRDGGASMVEYSILAVLIAAVCIVIITTVGSQTQSLYQSVVDGHP